MKQQAAVEFIITYSWAILIISLFVVLVLLISGTRPPQTYLQSSCNIQPLLPCTESLITYNSSSPMQYYVVFSNQLGHVLYFPLGSAINVTTTGTSGTGSSNTFGSCTPTFAGLGASVLCTTLVGGNSKPNVGTQVIVNFILTYSICTSAPANAIYSNSLCPNFYKSSGYSIQSVAPPAFKINYVTFKTNSNGTIILNGVSYIDSTTAYLPSGNYTIFAQPNSDKKFIGWIPISSVKDPCAPNTTFVLNSITTNIINAVFVSSASNSVCS
jgi:hypothetical protein